METIYLNKVASTHTYLQNYIKQNGYTKPTAVITQNQTNGIGSRDNKWIGEKGNLFFSFVLDVKNLPKDLSLSSASIYFSFLLKEILQSKGSKVWIKWPNDFYLKNKKIGGTITNLKNNLLYCGIGLNLNNINNEYASLDIEFKLKEYLELFFLEISKQKNWKQIFSKYLIEFENSRTFKVTIDNSKTSLQNAVLNSDGSITLDNKKVFSLR